MTAAYHPTATREEALADWLAHHLEHAWRPHRP